MELPSDLLVIRCNRVTLQCTRKHRWLFCFFCFSFANFLHLFHPTHRVEHFSCPLDSFHVSQEPTEEVWKGKVFLKENLEGDLKDVMSIRWEADKSDFLLPVKPVGNGSRILIGSSCGSWRVSRSHSLLIMVLFFKGSLFRYIIWRLAENN